MRVVSIHARRTISAIALRSLRGSLILSFLRKNCAGLLVDPSPGSCERHECHALGRRSLCAVRINETRVRTAILYNHAASPVLYPQDPHARFTLLVPQDSPANFPRSHSPSPIHGINRQSINRRRDCLPRSSLRHSAILWPDCR